MNAELPTAGLGELLSRLRVYTEENQSPKTPLPAPPGFAGRFRDGGATSGLPSLACDAADVDRHLPGNPARAVRSDGAH